MKKSRYILMWLSVCLMGVTSTAFADLYMKVAGIAGGSTDKDHRDWSNIDSLSGNFSEGYCGNFIVEKSLDTASVKLIEKAYTGAQIARIEFDNVVPIGRLGERNSIASIEIGEAQIVEVATNADEGPLVEQLTLNGERVKITSYQYDGDGGRLGSDSTILTCPKKIGK